MSLADLSDVLAAPFREPPDEILNEQRDIFRSFAQRRNRDWEDI